MSARDRTPCEECRAIFEELRAASASIRPSRKVSEESRAHFETLGKMMAGHAESADELLGKYPFRPQVEPFRMSDEQHQWLSNPRIIAAARRMAEHQVRTGHHPFRDR